MSIQSASSAVSLISNMILKSPDECKFYRWCTGNILTSTLLQILSVSGNRRLRAHHQIGSDPILLWIQLQGRGAAACWVALQGNTKSPRSGTNHQHSLRLRREWDTLGWVCVTPSSAVLSSVLESKELDCCVELLLCFSMLKLLESHGRVQPACCHSGREVVCIPWLFWKAGLLWEGPSWPCLVFRTIRHWERCSCGVVQADSGHHLACVAVSGHVPQVGGV